MKRSESRSNAFTLIELMVAMAIIATIMTMVYGSYAATSRSLSVYDGRMACSERAQLVLRLMARQVRCAYAPPSQADSAMAPPSLADHDNAPYRAVPRKDESKPASILFQGSAREARGEILRFATTGGFSVGPDGPMGLSRIAYRYDKPAGVLAISCEPHMPGPRRSNGRSVWRPVLTGVTGIDLEFHDGKQWQYEWDAKETRRLPQAIRIAVTVTDENGRAYRYGTTVPVACRTAVQERLQITPAGKP